MNGLIRRGSLEGVKVLDLSRWIAGPFATMLMADAGADVIKVEGVKGEDARHTAPQLAGTSAYVHHYNRNKRGLAIDMRDPRGQSILRTLAIEWADVLVENFRPGVLDRMGLGFDQLHEVNPSLIVTSISGYGESGPRSQEPCFNAIAEAFSGAMSLTGEPDAPPTMSGHFAADHSAGLYAAVGTLLALVEQRRSGVGQRVEVALTDSMLSVLGFALTARMNDLQFPDRTGNRDNATAPADLFMTKDGVPVYIDAGTDALFGAFCEVMGTPSLAVDPRFASNTERLANLEALHEHISTWVSTIRWSDLRTGLAAGGVPHSRVHTVSEAVDEPYFRDKGMIARVQLSNGESVNLPGMVLRLSETPGCVQVGAPAIGEHTIEILRETCRLNDDDIAKLSEDGLLVTPADTLAGCDDQALP